MVVGRTMSRVTVSTVNSEGYGRTLRITQRPSRQNPTSPRIPICHERGLRQPPLASNVEKSEFNFRRKGSAVTSRARVQSATVSADAGPSITRHGKMIF
jgi:hypothetical protein